MTFFLAVCFEEHPQTQAGMFILIETFDVLQNARLKRHARRTNPWLSHGVQKAFCNLHTTRIIQWSRAPFGASHLWL